MARLKYACDFETTTKLDDCRVWGYGIRQLYNKANLVIGNTMDEFMEWCESVKADLYFHNLKFDGSFIVNWLLHNGFTYSKTPQARTFNVLISRMNSWYMIDICYGYKGKRKLHTVIYDSLKKLPFTIKEVAKAFNLEVMKGDIDYDKERPPGYEITDEEKEYIKNDVEILAQALEIQFDQGLDKMTNGADALSDFKTTMDKKMFEKNFPVLSLGIDENIRKAYRGGFTYVNPRFQNQVIEGGIVLDINSMYPAIMMNKELPIGQPLPFSGKYKYDEEYPLYVQHISCEFDVKDDMIPTIQIKKNPMFKATEYVRSTNGERVDLYLSSVDMELFLEHYDVHDIEYGNGFKFRSATGMFKEYIEKWTEVKVNNTGAIRLLAKLMLNSLYGKFGSNPDVTGKEPYLDEDGSNKFKEAEEEIKDPVYIPMGLFITSYGREQIIRTAQSVHDRFIYCDTDSVHLTGEEVPEELKDYIHPTELGKWDLEGYYERGRYLRAKTYAHEYLQDDGSLKTKVTCAGMPDDLKKEATIETFEPGFSGYGRLMPKQVEGGVVLVDTIFTLKG